jgi:hypothetical protein
VGRCGSFDNDHPHNEREMDTWVTDEEFIGIMCEPSARGSAFTQGKHAYTTYICTSLIVTYMCTCV